MSKVTKYSTFLCQVLIFAEKKADVDAIHEYLLLKGVEAVAIHGGKGTQKSVLIINIHSSHYIVIVYEEDYCMWRFIQPSIKFSSDLLVLFDVVAPHYHQMTSCWHKKHCTRFTFSICHCLDKHCVKNRIE